MDNIKYDYDTIIIGFGKAGKTLAVKLKNLGQKVALVEKDENMYGGTCINIGCIPSKRLVSESKKLNNTYSDVIKEKNEFISNLRIANYNKLKNAGVDIIDAKASFINENTIAIKNEKNNVDSKLCAKTFVINTGATPFIPNIKGLDNTNYYTSTTIMSEEKIPKELVIIGTGYIALEFANMYSNFGSKVTLIGQEDTFMPREDEDIANIIKEVFEKKNIEVILNANIKEINNNKVILENKEISFTNLLVATGRKPNTDGLNLENANIILRNNNTIATDEYLRARSNIYAAGDVTNTMQFTYISLDDSRIIYDDIVNNKSLLEKRSINNRQNIPYSLFVEPVLSRVGITTKDAKNSNLDFTEYKMNVEMIPNAKVIKKTTGLIKVLVDNRTQNILGASLLCENSQEIINIIKLVMDNNMKYTVLKDFIFTHPTISEMFNDLFS